MIDVFATSIDEPNLLSFVLYFTCILCEGVEAVILEMNNSAEENCNFYA